MSRILIVEDEFGYQMLLGEILGAAGHQVTPACSGAQALEMTRCQQFDLLLIDNLMPGISGLEFLRQIRRAGHQAPAIVMTAYADVPVVVESMRLGAVDFLVKPFGIETVLPMVNRYLHTAMGPRGPRSEASYDRQPVRH